MYQQPMSFSPLSLAEVQRRRAQRVECLDLSGSDRPELELVDEPEVLR